MTFEMFRCARSALGKVGALLVLLLVCVRAYPAETAVTADQVIARMTKREARFLTEIRAYSPLLETYIQEMKPDKELGFIPGGDNYFLGRLDMSRGVGTISFSEDKSGWIRRIFGALPGINTMKYSALDFAAVVPDQRGLDVQNYDFKFVRREFLGEVRCYVFDIRPKQHGHGRFVGRIWVEDQDYVIVRFNGSYISPPHSKHSFHFDSWRLNMGPNLWLPGCIFSEEIDLSYGLPHRHVSFKAQTRLWGYNVNGGKRQDDLTKIVVEPGPGVLDQSDTRHGLSPIESTRRWHSLAEQNVIERLQEIGLIAPEGEVDNVLNTVVNNLEISNKIELQPDVRCRLLLTTPLESFDIGHTIVVSRGLLDVLPDEPSLAAILAHELAHILLNHGLNSDKYAFSDRMIFPDEAVYRRIRLADDPEEEKAADQKALELLKNSPYNNQLSNAGLFLRALEQRAPVLPHLIRGHLGNGLALGRDLRLSELIATAPALESKRLDQIAALPMGSRIHVDSWNDKAELSKRTPVALLTDREKMMFEVTPVFPWVSRIGAETSRVNSPSTPENSVSK
jgi:hypothetical protein